MGAEWTNHESRRQQEANITAANESRITELPGGVVKKLVGDRIKYFRKNAFGVMEEVIPEPGYNDLMDK